jgi:4-hydroxybenzoate polyprenyltransferase
LLSLRRAGKISEEQVVQQFLVLLAGGIGTAAILDVWAGHEWPIMTTLALGGSFISYIYSAPPLKLKQNGWAGNYALGSSYIALPWWAGQALFGTLTPDVMVLTIMYSLAGLGIAIVNDFKSIEGDRYRSAEPRRDEPSRADVISGDDRQNPDGTSTGHPTYYRYLTYLPTYGKARYF